MPRSTSRSRPQRDGRGVSRRATHTHDHDPSEPPMNAVLQLDESAHEHLLMHFTRNGAFGPDGKPLLVLERGEGAYVFDTEGKRYFDGSVVAVLLPDRLLVRRGDGGGRGGEQMSTLAFNTNWATAHPPAIKLAAALAERAARRPQPRVLHQRRLGVGRGRLEDRPPALPGQGRAAAHQGDRARDRLPRGDAGRVDVHRRAADEGAVRRGADPGRRGSPTPTRYRDPDAERRRRASARGCSTRSSARSSRPGRRRWRC